MLCTRIYTILFCMFIDSAARIFYSLVCEVFFFFFFCFLYLVSVCQTRLGFMLKGFYAIFNADFKKKSRKTNAYI